MRDPNKIYSKIIDYIEKIEVIIDGLDFEKFIANDEKVFACSFALCQIAEQTIKLSDEEKQKHAHIPWANIRGMRNHTIHNYDNIDFYIMWDALIKDLPKLKSDIQIIAC